MTKTVAIAGKGGTGKTTIAAPFLKLFSQRRLVLAVHDAITPLMNLYMSP